MERRMEHFGNDDGATARRTADGNPRRSSHRHGPFLIYPREGDGMGSGSLLVTPGPPDVAERVEIDCSGLEASQTVQLLINGTVRGTIDLDIVGVGELSYIVPAGPIRNALADMRFCDGQGVLRAGAGDVLSSCATSEGDSMVLRYAP